MDTRIDLRLTAQVQAQLPQPFLEELGRRTFNKMRANGWEVKRLRTLFSYYKLRYGPNTIAVTVGTTCKDDGTLLMLIGLEEELKDLDNGDDDTWLEKFKGDAAQPVHFEYRDGKMTTRPMVSDGAHRLKRGQNEEA